MKSIKPIFNRFEDDIDLTVNAEVTGAKDVSNLGDNLNDLADSYINAANQASKFKEINREEVLEGKSLAESYSMLRDQLGKYLTMFDRMKSGASTAQAKYVANLRDSMSISGAFGEMNEDDVTEAIVQKLSKTVNSMSKIIADMNESMAKEQAAVLAKQEKERQAMKVQAEKAAAAEGKRLAKEAAAEEKRLAKEAAEEEKRISQEVKALQKAQLQETREKVKEIDTSWKEIINDVKEHESSLRSTNKLLDEYFSKMGKQEFDTTMSRSSRSEDRTSAVSTDASTGDLQVIKSRSEARAGLQKQLDMESTTIGKLKILWGTFTGTIKDNTTAVDNNSKSVDKGNNSFKGLSNSLTGNLVKFRIISGAIRGVVSTFGAIYEKAASYEEAINLYTTSLGEYAEQGREWASEISTALYLDESDILQYTGALYNLVQGLGVGKEAAYTMSTNLTQLAYDMSSFLNIDVQAAYDKLQSAITGQSRAVASAGIAMQQASLQELATELNIKKKVATMTQAEKTYLRYIQILRSTTNMQGDLAKTIITPENALRVVKQQFTLLARAIGQVFIPIVMKAIPYVMALTRMLTDLANRLASLAGFKIADVDYSKVNDFNKLLGGTSDKLDGVGASAKGAKDSINRTLAAFDDLNVVESESKGSGGAGAGAGGSSILGDLEQYITGYDMLQGLNDQLSKNVESATNNLKILFGVLGAFAIGKLTVDIVKLLSHLKEIPDVLKNAKLGMDLITKGLAAIGIPSIGTALAIVAAVLVEVYAAIKNIGTLNRVFSEWNAGLDINISLWEGVLLAISGANGVGMAIALLAASAKDSIQPIDVLNTKISETSKKKLTPLVEEFEEVQTTIEKIKFSGVFTEEDANTIVKNISKMSTSVQKELDSDNKSFEKSLKTMKDSLGDNYSDILGSVQNYYTEQKNIVSDSESKINEIISKAKDENRVLTASELETINTLNRDIMNAGVASMTESEEEFKKIQIRLNADINSISVTEASKYLKNAAKTRDKAIETAKDQYTKTVLEAEKLRDAGAISDEEYNKIVKGAEKTRDDAIKSAKEQYDGIVQKTKEGLGENAKYIDEETGKIKSNWTVFWEGLEKKASDIWTDIKDGISKGWKKIKDWWGNNITPFFDGIVEKLKPSYWTSKIDESLSGVKTKLENFKFPKLKIEWSSNGATATGLVAKTLKALDLPTTLPKLNVKWFAQGGFPDSGDLFFANENGVPEYITSIGNRSAVANQDQMVAALSGAIITAMSKIPTGGSQPGNTVVYIGNDKVYEGQGKYQDRQTERYGTTYVNV